MTPTRSLILFPHEIRTALRGELRLVVRPVMPQPGLVFWNTIVVADYGGWTDEHGSPRPCPLGVPGTLVVGKETWAHYQTINSSKCQDGRAFAEVSDGLAAYKEDGYGTIEDFKKHVSLICGYDLEGVDVNGDRWRSPATMPSWASRITLEVVSVGVCRLQESYNLSAREWFKDSHEAVVDAWNTRYAAKGLGWDSNCWCWKVEVKGVEK